MRHRIATGTMMPGIPSASRSSRSGLLCSRRGLLLPQVHEPEMHPKQQAGQAPIRTWPATIRGAPGPIRTADTRFRKPVLYPLSYGGVREDILPSSSNACHEILVTSCWRGAPWRLSSRPGAQPARHSRDGVLPQRTLQASCRCIRQLCAQPPCERDDARASRTRTHQ